MLLSRNRLVLLTTFLLLSAFLYHTIDLSSLSSHLHLTNGFLTEPASLGVILHPDSHIFRGPKTIKHTWKITSGIRSPDGVEKLVYLINGQFPGPLIEARSGDEIEVEIQNGLRDEGVAIHWHGLWMRGANEMDGAVGLTQCPIRPSKSFTYKFKIDDDQAGTFWYHAHSELQRADGMYGGLVIHKPVSTGISEQKEYNYDEEMNLLIGDWYHRPSHEVQAYYKDFSNSGNEPSPDSLLINGKGYFNCSMAVPAHPIRCKHASVPRVKFEGGRTRLRIVNTGAMVGYTISLIGYTMRVIQVDGGSQVSNAPNALSAGILYPGERMDVIIEHSSEFDEHTAAFRIEMDSENLQFRNFALTEIQDFPIITNTTKTPPPSTQNISPLPLFDLEQALGPTSNLPDTADDAIVLYTKIEILGEYNNAPKGFINQTSWSSHRSNPLPLLALGRSDWGNEFVPYIQTGEGRWVDIVLNNFDDRGHPFHLHGNDFFILSSHQAGIGGYDEAYNPFDYSNPPAGGPSNILNPVKKDTVFVSAMGYVVLRVNVSNMGLWFFHCHVLWHQAVGMAMAFHVGENEEGLLINGKTSKAGVLC